MGRERFRLCTKTLLASKFRSPAIQFNLLALEVLPDQWHHRERYQKSDNSSHQIANDDAFIYACQLKFILVEHFSRKISVIFCSKEIPSAVDLVISLVVVLC